MREVTDAERAQAVREVLAAEVEQHGRPASIRAPFSATINGNRFTVTPCSGAHRAYWLSGYVVLSCSKCKAEPMKLVRGEGTFEPNPDWDSKSGDPSKGSRS